MSKHPQVHRARKRFGQNFLVDEGIIRQIIRSIAVKEDDSLVEIGPGKGALTHLLIESCPNLQVIELDRDLIPGLLAQFAKYPGFRIHQADALKFDFAALTTQRELRIVGNLPYNISTPLLFHLLNYRELIKDMHFMLQREVVQRLVATPGDKNYGRLGIMAQYFCAVEHILDVPPDAFQPAPKVDSAVVRLIPYSTLPLPAKQFDKLELLVKTAFSQRRKTLRNSLKNLDVDFSADQMTIDLNLRAENLSLRDYVELCNMLWP